MASSDIEPVADSLYGIPRLIVRFKDTGGHATIAAEGFDPELHVPLKESPVDGNGRVREPKPRVASARSTSANADTKE